MKTIKDSVHDHIDVQGIARALLDTPALQRLRRISQLGTVSLVYPSANHTRFEHSLGVYHLADRALAHLPARQQRAKRVRAAAILHDVGHAPFSHNVEELLARRTGTYHDEVHDRLDSGEVGDVLREYDVDPAEVADLVAGEGRYGQLVSGELDVDRMDYLVRDAHHTGVPYGTIDHSRLVRELTFRDNRLVLGEGNVQTAESLLIARALMNPTVYRHHVARISKSMLRRGTEALIDEGEIDAEAVSEMDDPELLVALRNCEPAAIYARRLDDRELFKRAVWAELEDVPEHVVDADHETVRELEGQIARKASVPEEAVILDVPERPSMPESSSRVVVNGEVRPLAEQSPLVEALRAAQHSQGRLGVYAPQTRTEAVGPAAVDVLGIDVDDVLVTEVRGYPATLSEFTGEE
ncbi:HD superfamily phosphohydrolase [Salinarchaeum sp. Harcht-Bsk1]|uniref:HD domain-containing protein n=1 Tax=Salinarchaeum sp. Harcht-Bsk1 TaxID=1333523 RepID=UPI00034245D6|nr:HD domain-containing protein [Salinarchaeum sp. Harcht-Bsk1]AGN02245.1 HD superfamily phosphohydrolase [Salinarchaeum sp. Harcht-Bsk1]